MAGVALGRHPLSFHMAGVVLGDIHLRFVWQAWYLWDWAGSADALRRRGSLRGRRGTWRHPPSFHVAGVTSAVVLHGRRGTWRHPPVFCVAGVVLMGLGWLW